MLVRGPGLRIHRSRQLNACYRVVECVGLGYGNRLSRYTGLRTTPGNKHDFTGPGSDVPDRSLAVGEVILSYSIL